MKNFGSFWVSITSIFLATLFVSCHETNFKAIDFHRDGLVGVQPVDLKAHPQESFYRFAYTILGKPERVEHIRNGVLVDSDGWAAAEISRVSDGVRIEYRGANGQKAIGFEQIGEVRLTLQADGTSILTYHNPYGHLLPLRGEMAPAQRFVWDSTGRSIKRMLQDRAGHPVLSYFGSYYAETIERNEKGFVTSRSYVGLEEKPVSRMDWKYQKETLEVDANGDILSKSFFDAEGKPQASYEGCQTIKRTIKDGRLSTEACFDEKGMPAEMKNPAGTHSIVYAYDAAGRLTEIRNLNRAGEPSSVAAIPVLVRSYDEKGFLSEETFFGGPGKIPKPDANGVHRYVHRYDSFYRETALECYSVSGQPAGCLKNDAYHRFEQSFDVHGYSTDFRYFGKDKKPVNAGDQSVAHMVARHDDRGRLLESSFFGTDGKPMMGRYGFHKMKFDYDENGFAQRWSYLGPDEKPVDVPLLGFHRVEIKNNSRGFPEDAAFFDAKGMAVVRKGDDCHRQKMKYTDQGDRIQVEWFDGEGKGCTISRTEIHSIHSLWNDHVLKSEESVFTKDGKPATVPGTMMHRIEYSYYPDGRKKGEKRFSAEGKPAADGMGIHREEWFYYPDGRLKQIHRFGIAGESRGDFNY